MLVGLYNFPLCVFEAVFSFRLAFAGSSFGFGEEVLRPRRLFGGHVEAVHRCPDGPLAGFSRKSLASVNELLMLFLRDPSIQVFVVSCTIGIQPCHVDNAGATRWYVVGQSKDIPELPTLCLRAS